MKYLLQLTLLGVLLLSSCSPNKYDYDMEQAILECFYKEKGIEIKESFDQLEAVFVKFHVLKNKSGTSYIAAIKKIRDSTDFIFENPELYEALKGFKNINFINCQSIFYELKDSTLFNNSRLIYLNNIHETINERGDITPQIIAEGVLKNYKAEDFEHNFYKSNALMGLATFYIIKTTSSESFIKMPNWNEEEPDITKLKIRNVYSVIINAENQLIVKGKLMDMKELRKNTKIFISNPLKNEHLAESPVHAIISLKHERKTKYKTYLAVYNELKSAYDELWNELSNELYHKDYDELDKEQKNKITQMIPFIISEAEPTTYGEEN